jgi:hypothetical protein
MITKALTAVSLNCQWPGFASTQRTAAPWSRRVETLVARVGHPDLIMAQELGQGEAAQFFAKLGEGYGYQRFGPLNVVGWRKSRLDLIKNYDIDLEDLGQWPGRGAIAVLLKDDAGNHLAVASSHLAVKTSNPAVGAIKASLARGRQAKVLAAKLKSTGFPTVVGLDANSRKSDPSPTSPRRVLARAGLISVPGHSGIDFVAGGYGALVRELADIDLGSGSDHDARHVSITTNRK